MIPTNGARSTKPNNNHKQLTGPARKEALVENIINQVCVDFDAGKIEAAKGRRTQVSDTGGGSADEHELVLECAGREFLLHRIGQGNVWIGSRGAVEIHHDAADSIGADN